MRHDFCVIGGGIVGLATALRLLERHKGAGLVLVEKEAGLARHQSGHNSGVIHAGVYYAPGSLKARLCRAGAAATKAFCTEHGVPFETRGKLIVATNADEHARMLALAERARLNGLEIAILDKAGLREMEPAVEGVGAIHVPASGIVDYRAVCQALRARIEALGGTIHLGEPVLSIAETGDAVRLRTPARTIEAGMLIACAGLQSDRVARLAGLSIDYRIVPFRGEFFRLAPRHEGVISHLIYPVPDPALPFLGIHLTPMIGGAMTVGPNAVLGLSREGIARFSFSLPDVTDMARFPGFWKLIAANWRTGAREIADSTFRARYLAQARRYYPALELKDLLPHPAGIRAQAVRADGRMVEDFLMLETARMVHVCNAPSPAATSALPIADMIVERVMGKRPALSAQA